ncbi:DUF6694 family lipoprotein [Litoribrevibacter euphylliae]|uniref:DUF6694 family lipoprotein n=1 Tax=Litoribrevibacter euphylliae TaxID=1834034 RepID=A0ABV7HDH9_9GAMM
MKFIKYVGILLITSVLTGCYEPTIDASSKETIKTSTQAIRDTLSDTEREEFDAALLLISFSQVEMKDLFSAGTSGAGEINLENKVKDVLHGKTASEVISEAARIKEEREKKAKQQALNEIQELETKLAKSKNAQTALNNFKVLRSRFYKEKQRFGPDKPFIELSVRNLTTHAVSRAYFKGTISSSGRSVPWHEDTFNYTIPGGLEPGESQNWHLAPNMFSDWDKVTAPENAVFTVVVEKLDGADGEALYSSTFTNRDRQRLNELKETYASVEQNFVQAEEEQPEEITAAQEEDWAEARRKRNLAFFNKNQERILRIAQQALDDKRYNRTLNLTDDYKTSDNPELQRIRKEAIYAIDRGW